MACVKYLLSIFTADCLRHPIQMVGIETIWELHTLSVINSCLSIYQNLNFQNLITFYNTLKMSLLPRHHGNL